MKVYISGPMTGIKDFNHPAFNTMQAALEAAGLEAVNPTCLVTEKAEGEAHWKKCMIADIVGLLDCDAIITLDGWHHSRGATLELVIARFLRMKFMKLVQQGQHYGFVDTTWPTARLIAAVVAKLKSM